MIPIVTAEQMRALDHRTITEAHVPSLVLMERAGAGVVAQLEARYGPVAGKSVLVLCGKGNNGGDGFVIARLLRRKKAKVHVLSLAPANDLSRDAKTMYQRFQRAAGPSATTRPTDAAALQQRLAACNLIVDAILGTGLSTPVTGLYRDAIEAVNAACRPTVAVDVPSGLHADTGAVLGAAVCADLTVTFGLPKAGLYCGAGIDCAGTVRLVDIGIPPSFVDAIGSRLLLLTGAAAHAALPLRRPSSHKGTYGHLGIIAGSVGKTGAAAMAAMAALRIELARRYAVVGTEMTVRAHKTQLDSRNPSWQSWLYEMGAYTRDEYNRRRYISEVLLGPELHREARRFVITETERAANELLESFRCFFVLPDMPGLDSKLNIAMHLAESMWERSYILNGEIDEETFEESIRMQVAYLRTVLPEVLTVRADPASENGA